MIARKSILSSVCLALLLIITQLPVPIKPVAAATSGLQNPGFEAGILDGKPNNWTVISAADAAVVVDAEGPPAFPAYGV